MSEATSSPNFNANLIPTALQLNTALRTGAADLAHLMQYLLSGASVPGAGLVMGGLDVVGKANDMRVDVLAGYGAVYNGAVTPPEHPLEAVVLREDDVSPLLNDGDGTDPRIDVISVDPSSSLFDQEPLQVPEGGGSTQDAYTRRGPGYAIQVTEGVPNPSPAAPSTPTGSLKLAEVLVPAGLTAAGGGTASATITDHRNRASLEVKGPDSSLEGWRQLVSTWSSVVDMLTLVGVLDADGKALQLVGDLDEHWPAFFRSDVPSGDQAGYLYPMVIPLGREYWIRTMAVKGSVVKSGGAGVKGTDWDESIDPNLTIYHITNVSANIEFEIPIPADIRGLEIIEFDVDYTIGTAFNSNNDVTLQLKHFDRSAGTKTIKEATSPDSTVTGLAVAGLAVDPSFVLDTGDAASLHGFVVFEAVNDGAVLTIWSVGIKVREGRA